MTLRIIFIFLAACLSFAACKSKQAGTEVTTTASPNIQADTGYFPKPIGYVNDYIHLYTPEQAHTLDSLVKDYEKKTTMEIVIVTLDSNMVGQQRFDLYTLKLANNWGVGKKEKNNGMLIAIAPYMRRMRIENGKGIEEILSNDETKAIIDSVFIPKFKENNFFEGTREGVLAIMTKLKPVH